MFLPCCHLKTLKFLRMNQVCQLLLSASRKLCNQNICMKELVMSILEAGCVSLYVNFSDQRKFLFADTSPLATWSVDEKFKSLRLRLQFV